LKRTPKEIDFDHVGASTAFLKRLRRAFQDIGEPHELSSTHIREIIEELEALLDHTPSDSVPYEWTLAEYALRAFESHLLCEEIAKSASGDLLKERARAEVLGTRLRQLLKVQRSGSKDYGYLHQYLTSLALNFESNVTYRFAQHLISSLPLPTLYWRKVIPRVHGSAFKSTKSSEPIEPVLRIVISIDNAPLTAPTFLRPHVLYALRFRIRGLGWPDEAHRLHITLSTTCPPTEYSASEFFIERPLDVNCGDFEAELPGHIRFHSAQSSVLEDLVFAISGAFETVDRDYIEVPLIGHTEMRLRVSDTTRLPLATGNAPLDQHVVRLITELIRDCPEVQEELSELFDMLQALTKLVATYSQEAAFKGRSEVSEHEFQRSVARDLRFQLGSDVQEHTNQAGGITDIRFRGVIVELKVERENGDRSYIIDKYIKQSVQYSGVEARQVSVLLVLDTTVKDSPTGDIKNDILLADVESHGGKDTQAVFPSKVFAFVINGNTRSPSEYSR